MWPIVFTNIVYLSSRVLTEEIYIGIGTISEA